MIQADPPRLPPAYRFIASWLQPLLTALTKREWHGVENLPRDGGFVACPNHLSYYDPFAIALFLYANGRPPFFLGKEEVFRIPVLGRLIRAADQVPVYRGTEQAADAYRAALAGVEAGKCVVMFPEGTLTRDPQLWPMRPKTGAARLALATRCPVVPIALWGPQDVLGTYEKRVRLIPRKTIRVSAGPPVDLSDLYDRAAESAALREAADRIVAAITTQLETLRGETAPPQRLDSRTLGLPEVGNFKRGRR